MKRLNECFDKVYVINLPFRTDRREEIEKELLGIGVDMNSENISIFPAVRPLEANGFPSIGARGCFESHHRIIKDALVNAYHTILILEDDAMFPGRNKEEIAHTIEKLLKVDWDIFYGGYENINFPSLDTTGITLIDSEMAVQTAHFIAIKAPTIDKLNSYFEKVISRPPGDPKGGPMHVDGAYSWFRKENPDVRTYISRPKIAIQRPSPTDIHEREWYDQLPFLSLPLKIVRKIKFKLKSKGMI
jgi:glycosyl transferase family 25